MRVLRIGLIRPERLRIAAQRRPEHDEPHGLIQHTAREGQRVPTRAQLGDPPLFRTFPLAAQCPVESDEGVFVSASLGSV